MRARNIKPGIFKNEELGVRDPMLTLLFIGLWCLADRDGRLEDRPLRINAEVFPYRNVDYTLINGGLTELEQLGFIQRYEANGIKVIEINKFVKHQRPHSTEKAGELPARPPQSTENKADTEITVNPPLNNGESTVKERPDSLITDSLITDSFMGEKSPKTKMKKTGSVIDPDFFPNERAVTFFNELLPGDDLKLRVREFINYWSNVKGPKATKIDWNKTFENRVMQIKEWKEKHERSSNTNDTSEGRSSGSTDKLRGRIKGDRI